MEERWCSVRAQPVQASRRSPAMLRVLSAMLLVPAVIMLVNVDWEQPVKTEELSSFALGGETPAWPDAIAGVEPFTVPELAQKVTPGSKRAVIKNVLTQLAEKVKEESSEKKLYTPDDKVVLTMFMESECPACRRFSTTIVKQILDAPGVGNIVDFRAVPWGWGTVVEAPTERQLKTDPHAFNILNRTRQLLPILTRLGATGAETPPLHFMCQHGEGECTGNAFEACLQDVAPDHKLFFPVMDCMESRTCAEGMKPPSCVGQPAELVNQCIYEFGHGINTQKLNECFTGARVQELMIMNDLETMNAKPQWVPWFQLDGKSLVDVPKTGGNTTALFRQQFLLGKKICDLYVAKTGQPAPKGCSSFWQNEAEVPKDPFASFKETNFTALIAKLDLEKKQRAQLTGSAKHVKTAHAGKSAKSSAAAKSSAFGKKELNTKIQKVRNFADRFFAMTRRMRK